MSLAPSCARQSERDVSPWPCLPPVQRRASTPASRESRAVKTKRLARCKSRARARARASDDDNVDATYNHVAGRPRKEGAKEGNAVGPRAPRAYVCATRITYARSLVHDALTATRPRTVIGAGESESVPVAADSVVHKRGGRRLPLFRSGIFSSLSLSLALPLALSFPFLRAAYSRRQAKACTLSTYSVRCAGVLSGARVYIKAAGLSAIRPHTPDQSTLSLRETSPFLRRLLLSPRFSPTATRASRSLPSVRTRERRDPRIHLHPLPLNPLSSYAERTLSYVSVGS